MNSAWEEQVDGSTWERQGRPNAARCWFVSDTHFGHANILKYSNRPFNDVGHMNEALIAGWNSVVQPEDAVYHLGDFGFMKEDELEKIIKRLNGRKTLLFGNHDKVIRRSTRLQRCFDECREYHELWVADPGAKGGRQFIVLCHYPFVVWNHHHHGSWMLHGHCHGNLRYPFVGKIMDVGVDPCRYLPVSYAQVKARMVGVKPQLLDHHGDHEDVTDV